MFAWQEGGSSTNSLKLVLACTPAAARASGTKLNLLLLCLAWCCLQRLRAVSSEAMADAVFSNPELQQCIKQDLLWQLQLAKDIRKDEVCLTMCLTSLGSTAD
jgi:hypothetical protein